MPLSTSSSRHRAPEAPWARIITAAVVVALVAVGAIDIGWRVIGHQPEIRDSADYWVGFRQEARSRCDVVALVGSSRLQLGVDPDRLGAALGRPVAQLSINGGNPMPVLTDLANDPDFCGLAIVEVMPARFFAPFPDAVTKAKGWVASAKHPTAILPLELSLRAALQGNLTVLRADLSPMSFAGTLARTGRLPTPARQFHANRMITWDPDEPTARRKQRSGLQWHKNLILLTPEELASQASRLGEEVEAIRARGGAVAFFRLPSSGDTLAIEAERFPRAAHYDVLSRSIPAARWLHFEDLGLGDLTCPDGSHLRSDDRPRVTDALAVHL